VATLGGLPIGFALTGAKADERQTLLGIFDADPHLVADRPGQTIIADKNYFGKDFENELAQAGLRLLRPPARARTPGPAAACSSRCAKSWNRSIKLSKGSSTWNDTAEEPRPESSSESCDGSSPLPPRSGTTTKQAHRAGPHATASVAGSVVLRR
jgi:hypothetical protein